MFRKSMEVCSVNALARRGRQAPVGVGEEGVKGSDAARGVTPSMVPDVALDALGNAQGSDRRR
jgi:hypothetical protein